MTSSIRLFYVNSSFVLSYDTLVLYCNLKSSPPHMHTNEVSSFPHRIDCLLDSLFFLITNKNNEWNDESPAKQKPIFYRIIPRKERTQAMMFTLWYPSERSRQIEEDFSQWQIYWIIKLKKDTHWHGGHPLDICALFQMYFCTTRSFVRSSPHHTTHWPHCIRLVMKPISIVSLDIAFYSHG